MSRLSSSATTIPFCKWASKNSPPPPLAPTAFSLPTLHPRNPATIAASSPLIISTRSSLARPLPRTSASPKSPPAAPASSISSPAPVLQAPKMLSPTICPRSCAGPARSRNYPLPSASASRSPAMFPFSAASRMPPSSARPSCPKLKKPLCQILHRRPLTPPLPLLLLVSARSRKLPATVFPAARPQYIGARSPHEYPSNPSSPNVFLSTFNFRLSTSVSERPSMASILVLVIPSEARFLYSECFLGARNLLLFPVRGGVMNLDDWRRRIDEIDKKLVELLNERSRCALKIGRLKQAANLPLYQPEREKEVLQNAETTNQGPLTDAAIRRLFERIIYEARAAELDAIHSGDSHGKGGKE